MKSPLLLRRVEGESMMPNLKPRSLLLVSNLFKPTKNSIVVASVNNREIVKRVSQTSGPKLFLTGDNALSSTDSRAFGWIDKNQIVGKVIWPKDVYSKPNNE